MDSLLGECAPLPRGQFRSPIDLLPDTLASLGRCPRIGFHPYPGPQYRHVPEISVSRADSCDLYRGVSLGQGGYP